MNTLRKVSAWATISLAAFSGFGCDGGTEMAVCRDACPGDVGGLDASATDASPETRDALASDAGSDTDAIVDGGTPPVSTDLPDWYEENRIQGLTGALPVTNLELVQTDATAAPISNRTARGREITAGFLNANEETSELGLRVVTRFVKNDWRGPLWPSLVPAGDDDPNPVSMYPDNLRWLVDDAHGRGMYTGVYYWDGGEGRSSATESLGVLGAAYTGSTYDWAMPRNWLCKDLAGNPIKATEPDSLGRTRGYLADFSSPFRGFTRTRLIEMGERNVDIFYFDERHTPNTDLIHIDGACFGASTEILYRATGATMPAAKDWNDPAYRDYVAFQGDQLTEAFTDWKGAVRRRGHHGLFVISGTYLSVFTLPYMNLELAAVADSVKVEYLNGIRGFLADNVFTGSTPIATPPRDIGLSLGWIIPRDGAGGRPPNLWFNGMENPETVRAFVATAMSYGAVANLNINDGYLRGTEVPINPNATSYANLREGIAFGRTIADVMAYARPYKYAAIHLSDRERNAVGDVAGSTWPKEVWKRIMWPVTGAFAAFVRSGLPVTIITDDQIARGDLDDYAVLYSPSPSSDPVVAAQIEAFEREGGLVLEHDNTLALSDPVRSTAELARLTDQVSTSLGGVAPLRATFDGVPPGQNPHAVFHRRGNTIVAALTNDFAFVSNHHRLTNRFDERLPFPAAVVGAGVSITSACEPIAPTSALTGRALTTTFVDGRYVISGLADFQEAALVTFDVGDCR